jgi:hypothetical protein
MAQHRVTVVDVKNHERVLGTIPAPAEMEGRGRVYPIMRPAHIVPWRSTDEMPDPFKPHDGVASIRMEIVPVRETMKGWKRITEYGLATDAPLNDLCVIKGFLLPGETEREAERRRIYAFNLH